MLLVFTCIISKYFKNAWLSCSKMLHRSSAKSRKQLSDEEITKISFHKFPKNPERRNICVQAIRRVEWTPTDTSVLCSAHFEDYCFDRTSLSSIRLRDKAVSTIFSSFLSHLQKKEESFRKSPLKRSCPDITPIKIEEPQSCSSITSLHLDEHSSLFLEEKKSCKQSQKINCPVISPIRVEKLQLCRITSLQSDEISSLISEEKKSQNSSLEKIVE